MRILIVAGMVFCLSGCGLNYGEKKAVSKMTVGELIVSQSIDRNATRKDIDKKIAALSATAPFDVYKTLGDGCANVSITEAKIKRQYPDANEIVASFVAGKGYFVDMDFVGRALNVKTGYFYDSPLYFMGLRVRHENNNIYSGKEMSLDVARILSAMTVECGKLDGILNDINSKFEKNKENEMIKNLKEIRKKIVDDFIRDFEVDPGKSEEQRAKEYKEVYDMVDMWNPDRNLNEDENRKAFYKFMNGGK